MDYLWGRPTEVLMRTLTPESFAFPKPTRTMGGLYGRIVEWTRSGELTFEVEKFPLRDSETAWQRTDLRGRRLVAVP